MVTFWTLPSLGLNEFRSRQNMVMVVTLLKLVTNQRCHLHWFCPSPCCRWPVCGWSHQSEGHSHPWPPPPSHGWYPLRLECSGQRWTHQCWSSPCLVLHYSVYQWISEATSDTLLPWWTLINQKPQQIPRTCHTPGEIYTHHTMLLNEDVPYM